MMRKATPAEWKRRTAALAAGFVFARLIMRPMEWWLVKQAGPWREIAANVIPSLTGIIALAAVVGTFWFADRCPDGWWEGWRCPRLGIPWRSLAAAVLLSVAVVGGVVALAELQGDDLEWADVMGAD
jgi:hypothetical protein